MRARHLLALLAGAGLGALGCADEARRKLGESCSDNAQCASNFCVEAACLDPNGDNDDDSLSNQLEVSLGLSPLSADTDGDGKRDPAELDATHTHNVDTDGDGIADGLESATLDSDHDCIVDERDPQNSVPDPQGCPEQHPKSPWQVFFYPNIDVSACGHGRVLWCCQNIQVDGAGAFDDAWAPDAPNTVRVAGTIGGPSFSATISCLPAGTPSGTLSGVSFDGQYGGTFAFQQQSGAVLIAPWSNDTITLEGRVTAAGGTTPIEGAEVTVSVDADATTTTKPSGLFYLRTKAPTTGGDASWTISIHAQGYQPYAGTQVWGDHPQGQEFQLGPVPPP